jgi:hypothetical protein
MTIKTWTAVALLLVIIGLAFVGGFFLGRNNSPTPITLPGTVIHDTTWLPTPPVAVPGTVRPDSSGYFKKRADSLIAALAAQSSDNKELMAKLAERLLPFEADDRWSVKNDSVYISGMLRVGADPVERTIDYRLQVTEYSLSRPPTVVEAKCPGETFMDRFGIGIGYGGTFTSEGMLPGFFAGVYFRVIP